MATTHTDPTPARLPRELTEFLLDLALAVQRHGMYPGGHPSLDAATAALGRRLMGLLADRPVLSLGIARRQIVVEGVATDVAQPVLRVLAERLHAHRLGAVTLRRGITAPELHSFLRAIAADPERTEPVGGTGREGREAGAAWAHIGLHAITYEQLQLAAAEPEDEAAERDGRSTAAAQLWIGLAQAALARARGGPDGAEPAVDAPGAERLTAGDVANADPLEVARAINDHDGAHAYDQMIVGYMLQLAGELKRDGGGSAGVRRRVSQLIRGLEPRTLERLLRMGGDDGQRSRFLYDAADAVEAEAMVDLVRAAAAAQQQDISTSLVRLLTKLSTLADHAGGSIARHADAELRAQVRGLVDGWSLGDPNPDEYTAALQGMAAGPTTGGADERDSGADPLRIVQMALEVDVTGPCTARAVDTLLAAGRQAELFDLLEMVGDDSATAGSLWRQIGSPEHVAAMVAAGHVDFDALDQLLARLPADAVIEALLDGVCESESQETRRALFTRVAAFGASAVPRIAARLDDERPPVLRRLLALLNEIGVLPPSFSALPFARHEDAAVRREAVQLAMRLADERDAAVGLALGDADERVLRTGVTACRDGRLPGSAVRLVLHRIEDASLAPELRAGLIRLLDGHASMVVTDRLASIALRRRRFRRPALAHRSPELLAALWVLAGIPSPGAAAARAVALGRSSTDPQVAAAANRR